MRSSVSYMLSQNPGDPIMTHPDYEQHHYHHGCLLILVRGIGPLKPRSLQRVFERIQRVNNVKIPDSSGLTRDIWVRYIRDHPVENNDWGDFQTHRRLLGLITVGKFDNQNELNELCRVHESLKVKYTNTLFDSRCLLFGPSSEELHKMQPPTAEDKKDPAATIEGCFQTPSNFKSRAFFYPENDSCSNLETKISEFITSLYYILELKRMEKTREKVDKVPLLLAPFEKKDFVGLDLESRNNKKRCVGRMTKHLGDLTLQAGLVAESLNLFHSASETLRAISDSLWLGAAFEGLCAASAILLYPNFRYTMSIQRNSSLQENTSASSPQKYNLARNQQLVTNNNNNNSSYNGDAGSPTVRQKKSDMVINLNSETASIPDKTSASSNSSASSISSTFSSGSGGSTASGSSSSLTDSGTLVNKSSAAAQKFPPNILQPEDIPARYREAIINYSKYRNAGIIETEAALKAARICIEQGKNLDVAMFLQNVLYINLNMSEQQRVRRFEVLTDLYQKIGYNRKAAFCQRLAAWRHVAVSNTNPDWGQSYRLMLESFSGHKLCLEPQEVLENNTGWPVLQIDLLQQLVGTARRLGQPALATRHMTFLLQTMWSHLNSHDQKEMALQLQNLSSQCEGAPVPLVLENGTVIPPSNLTDLPLCSQLLVKDLPSHMRPVKIVVSKVDSGPFLFTPIHFSSIDRRQPKDDSKISFNWIQHDDCEVNVKLTNPLPFELQVTDIRLLTTGVVFEAFPQTVMLQPNVVTTVALHGTPIEKGELDIQGYSTHTLGIKSNCRLKQMLHRKQRNLPSHYQVNVIPALPKLELKTSLPQTATFSGMPNADCVTTSASITLYNGECGECVVTLTNTSNILIEYIDATFHSNMDATLQNRIFQLVTDEITAQLPIKPNESIDFKLIIYGEADFLGAIASNQQYVHSSHHDGTNSAGPQSLTVSHGGGGGGTVTISNQSIPSRISSPTGTHRRNDPLTSSFRSSHSGHSSLATLSVGIATGHMPRQLEAQLRFKYSGGEGLQEGFCRQCAISFNVELLPSAQITNWDVLSAEIPSQFYLVLDVVNLTAQEMSLNYTSNKTILIEAKESCRVPVPVDRCPLERILAAMDQLQLQSLNSGGDGYPSILSGVGVPSNSGDTADLTERVCSEHISENVNLKWSLPGLDCSGVASLRGITLSPTMLDLVTVPPLQWEVKIDKQQVAPQSEVTCVTGQFITLSVGICNLSASVLHQVQLSVQFYQDYQNGHHNYRLETRVTMTGPNHILIPALNKDEKAFHECSVLFFTPGRFKADIQCRSLSSTTTTSTVPSGPDFQQQPCAVASSSASSSHVWRFIPPVEITVIDQ